MNAQRPTSAGRIDAFMSRFGPTGTLLFCTYYGGSRNDAGRAIAVLPSGWAFVGGSTASPDFPVLAAMQPTFGGELDAFLLAISPTGGVAWSTFYGGTRSERGRALAVNAAGTLVFAGQTFSSDMPLLTPGAGAHRRQPRHLRRRIERALHGVHLRHLPGRQQQRRRQRRRRSIASGASSRPARPRIHRRARVGASDAFVYGISSAAAGDTDGDGLPDDWETDFGTDPSTNDAGADPDGDGFTNAQEFANHTHPTGYFTRYLAEGSTGAFFDDRIALFNPGDDIATVVLRFQRQTGAEIQQVLPIAARSRATVNPETIVGLENAAFSTVIESNQQVVVDRTMTWDGTGFGSHAETSIEQPSTTWYLAEGSTAGTFDLYYLLQNPNASAAAVTITYLRPTGAPVTKTYTVAPRSRLTVSVDTQTGYVGRPVERAHAAGHRRLGDDRLDQRRADPGRARDVHDRERARLRRRSRQRRRHRAADQLVPRRRRRPAASSTCSSCWPTRRRPRRRSRSPTCSRAAPRSSASTACRRRAVAPSTSTASRAWPTWRRRRSCAR